MAKIQDKDRYYFLFKQYVDFMFMLAYRQVEYHGNENIPKDGAIIYAPNHTNTLMDALAVLSIDKEPKVFVARADVFKQPTILKILTFFKMLPINRKRDGINNLAKNEEINNVVVDVLHDKVPFCILPEGVHRTKHSLMPLQKGIFRIAMQANDAFGNEMPVYIVPVGIEFGHFFRYRSSLLLQVGKPLNITEFVKQHAELGLPEQINALRDELSDKMKALILHIPDDANYDSTLELTQICGKEQYKRLKLKQNTLINKFTVAKGIIKEVGSLLISDQQKTQELLDKAGDFSHQRHKFGIGLESVLKPHIRLSLIRKLFFLLLGLPYFVFSSVVTAPVTLFSVWVCSKFKDRAFHNALRYLIALVLLPLFLLLTGIIFAVIFSWKMGIIFAIFFMPSFFFLHEYLRLMRLFVSDIKWLLHGSLHKQFKKINTDFSDLIK